MIIQTIKKWNEHSGVQFVCTMQEDSTIGEHFKIKMKGQYEDMFIDFSKMTMTNTNGGQSVFNIKQVSVAKGSGNERTLVSLLCF